jgi:hypothetical protein
MYYETFQIFRDTRTGGGKMNCCLCGKELPKDPLSGWDRGNNAEPVAQGRCCNECNITKVIPERLRRLKNKNIV